MESGREGKEGLEASGEDDSEDEDKAGDGPARTGGQGLPQREYFTEGRGEDGNVHDALKEASISHGASACGRGISGEGSLNAKQIMADGGSSSSADALDLKSEGLSPQIEMEMAEKRNPVAGVASACLHTDVPEGEVATAADRRGEEKSSTPMDLINVGEDLASALSKDSAGAWPAQGRGRSVAGADYLAGKGASHPCAIDGQSDVIASAHSLAATSDAGGAGDALANSGYACSVAVLQGAQDDSRGPGEVRLEQLESSHTSEEPHRGRSETDRSSTATFVGGSSSPHVGVHNQMAVAVANEDVADAQRDSGRGWADDEAEAGCASVWKPRYLKVKVSRACFLLRLCFLLRVCFSLPSCLVCCQVDPQTLIVDFGTRWSMCAA